MNQQKFTSNFINEFTDDEIKEQLNCLGFKNVPKDKFNQFKSELEKLITQEISMNTTNDSDNNNNNYNQYQAYTDTPLITNKSSNTDDNLGFRHRNQLIIPVEKNSNNHFKKVTFPDNETASIVDDSDCLEQSFASITTTTSSIVNNKLVKRKVVRKLQKNQVDDDLVESFENLKIPSNDEDEEDENENEEHFVKLNDCYPPINFPIKSFIRTQRSQSCLSSSRSEMSVNTSKSLKSNPVNRYHEYRKLWNRQKGPGEKKHSDLRWSIREQMLDKHVIVKKQHRVYEPNSYLIPTDKKRQELRWVVRSALAAGSS